MILIARHARQQKLFIVASSFVHAVAQSATRFERAARRAAIAVTISAHAVREFRSRPCIAVTQR
jgi:hypothetical protein